MPLAWVFMLKGLGNLDSEFMVYGSGSRVWDLGFRVEGQGSRG